MFNQKSMNWFKMLHRLDIVKKKKKNPRHIYVTTENLYLKLFCIIIYKNYQNNCSSILAILKPA